MSRVICALPNASTNINGVEYVPHKGGTMISAEELSDEQVAAFCEVEGYKASVAKPKGADPKPPAGAKPPADPKPPAGAAVK